MIIYRELLIFLIVKIKLVIKNPCQKTGFTRLLKKSDFEKLVFVSISLANIIWFTSRVSNKPSTTIIDLISTYFEIFYFPLLIFLIFEGKWRIILPHFGYPQKIPSSLHIFNKFLLFMVFTFQFKFPSYVL